MVLVAEKIRAPLYKMELGAFIDNDEGSVEREQGRGRDRRGF